MILTLNYHERLGYCLALLIICFALLTLASMVIAINRHRIKYTLLAITVTLLCITWLFASVFLEYIRVEVGHLTFVSNIFTVFMINIPLFVYVIFSFLSIAWAIFILYSVHIATNNSISRFSIKESIENLPMGLCFLSQDGDLSLSNHTMRRLSFYLTKKDLQNGLEFWSDLMAMRESDMCVISDENPSFILNNGEVWQFSKTFCTIGDEEYQSIKASNITQFYALSQNIEAANDKLKNQQQRLKNLLLNKEYNAAEQVAIDTKVQYHDDFGNLLVLTKKILAERPDESKLEDIVNAWTGLADKIVNKDTTSDLSLAQVQAFALKLNCELSITGQLPADAEKAALFLLIVNEMLKNAVYHAKADKLHVSFGDDGVNYTLTTENKAHFVGKRLVEGGGLSGIRQKVEHFDGCMEITSGDKILLTIAVPKGYSNWSITTNGGKYV